MIINLILFILILGIIVLVHESGHFLFAKLVGVHVYEFSIGMGPVLLQKKAKDGTLYSFRAIPIGGFVSLAGEETNVDLTKNKGKNLQDKTVFQRFLVMVMGVCFNFLLALFVLFVIGLGFGSTSMKPIITSVEEGYPAYNAGVEAGDTVLRINGHKIKYIDDISLYLAVENLDKDLIFEVKKQDDSIQKYIIKANTKDHKIGIELKDEPQKGFINAIIYSFKKINAIFNQMFVVLGSLFTGKLSINSLSGPVGIYTMVGQTRAIGVASVLYLIALSSVNVGIVNILPFPAFDGGRILFLFIEKIKGSPVSPKVENIIHSIGFVLLIILMIYVTISDILKFF